jgi:ubiquinone/menaquinone biosynthesis C-methylase UbiE
MKEPSKEVLQKLNQILHFCLDNSRQNETWPSYYKRRYLEFLSYLQFFPDNRYGRILELGCGVGYQSAFLSNFADEVVATDLPEEDIVTHTPGMLKAMELHRQLNIHNVKLMGCSAESMPFPDDSFDMVYSSHVLEHIPMQAQALREIFRVLKPGGVHFCVVPTSFEKVYSFFNYYLYLAKRSVYHLYMKLMPAKKNGLTITGSRKVSDIKSAANLQLKYFPFPPPHGHSKHFMDELRTWTPLQWRRRIEQAAPFTIVHQSSTQINPLLPILGGVFPLAGTAIHEWTRKTESRLGKKKIFQRIGVNTVMVFRKPI